MPLDFVRCLIVASGVFLLPALPAAAGTAEDYKTCIKFAETDAYDSDVEEACGRYLESGEGSVAERAAVFFAQARVIAADEDYESAVDDMDAAIELRPSAEMYLFRGKNLSLAGDDDKAIEDFNIFIKKNSKNAEAYYWRGRSYYLLGEAKSAMEDLDRTIKARPKFGEAYVWRGRLFADYFDFDSALRDFDKAVQYSPSSQSYYFRADALYFEGRMRDALGDLDEALKLAPNAIAIHRLRADCLEALAEYDQAIAAYDAILKLSAKDPEALGGRASVFMTKGNASGAIADYTAAMAVDPDTISLYYGRGRAFRAAGQYDEALADQNVYIESAPTAAIGYLEIGRTYAAMQDAANSETAWRKALELADSAIAANKYASNYARRGEINLALGLHDDALDDYNAAIRIDGTIDDYYAGRAEAYAAMGDTSAANADRARAKQIQQRKLGGEPAGQDDSATWGVTGPGTMQKLH